LLSGGERFPNIFLLLLLLLILIGTFGSRIFSVIVIAVEVNCKIFSYLDAVVYIFFMSFEKIFIGKSD
jgi:hypothetical protein